MPDYGYGIDFGTTNSVVSVCDAKNKVIKNFTNKSNPHPSVVWFREGYAPTVGEEAKKNLRKWSNVAGHQFEKSIKRKLGRNTQIDVLGRPTLVYQIASEIFKHLVYDAKQSGSIIEEAIITIPIDFNGIQRQDLRKAATEAGILIKTFIHEPFAAIIGHKYKQRVGLDISSLKNKNYLVFDWGGGTLDITVVKITKNGFVELATEGINERSGDFIDNLIMESIRNRVANRFNIHPDKIEMSRGAEATFWEECELKKRELSKNESVDIQVANAFQYQGKPITINEVLTREEFNSLIKDTVSEAINAIRVAFKKSRINESSIDSVLMIGGTSRIPLVQSELRKIFGSRLEYVSNADTIIAEGASIVDSLNLRPTFANDISIELSDNSLYPVFQKGTVAIGGQTAQQVQLFCTDNRIGKANLIIVENNNEDTIEHIRSKDNLVIPVDQKLPKPYNHERVDIQMLLDDNMVLQIKGKAATQEKSQSLEIHQLSFGLFYGD